MQARGFADVFKGTAPTEGPRRQHDSAAAKAKKEGQTLERQRATADYDAVRNAAAANMARLKELRLARDAELAAAAPPAAKGPVKKGAKKSAAVAQPTFGKAPRPRS